MTIKELYLLAKEKGILDYEIQIQYGDDGGIYDGTRDVMGIDVIIDDEDEIVVLWILKNPSAQILNKLMDFYCLIKMTEIHIIIQ